MSKPKNNLYFVQPKIKETDSPLFFYLPGMDGTGKLIHTQVDDLAKSFDIRSLIISPFYLANWNVLANDVIKLIEKELKTKNQDHAYLCGESFGGCLALHVAIKAPWLFQKLILINPASCFAQRFWLSLGSQFTPFVPDFIHRFSPLGLMPFLASLNKITPTNRQFLLDAMQSVPCETISWRLSLLRDFFIDNYNLSRLTQPALLIASAWDRLLPSVEEAKRLSNLLPQSKIRVLPHSGHACLLESDIKLYNILQEEDFLPNIVSKVLLST